VQMIRLLLGVLKLIKKSSPNSYFIRHDISVEKFTFQYLILINFNGFCTGKQSEQSPNIDSLNLNPDTTEPVSSVIYQLLGLLDLRGNQTVWTEFLVRLFRFYYYHYTTKFIYVVLFNIVKHSVYWLSARTFQAKNECVIQFINKKQNIIIITSCQLVARLSVLNYNNYNN
jgi:hypothetical protein